MQNAIYFKIIQRRNKYRNPKNLLSVPEDLIYTELEYAEAQDYIMSLAKFNIKYTYPTHELYPKQLLKMKEPPLFLEYIGEPIWMSFPMISVVGSREIEALTHAWMRNHFGGFLQNCEDHVAVVSGGARGVDQLAHQIAIKNYRPTLFVLPSGLMDLYPKNLDEYKKFQSKVPLCFLSEFEITQQLHKSHFYFRNRIIAAMGQMTLVAQANQKSGSLLTVHHCLENGRPVLSIPAHPEMLGFAGNIKLLQDGAFLVSQAQDLLDFWKAETRPNLSLV
jgi:DNA processing protein